LYIVKSASDPDTEYKVTWNRDFNRFQCQCKASNQFGLECWHMRSAFVNEMMYRQAKRDEAAAAARIAEELAEYERLMMIPPTKPSEAEVQRDLKRYQTKPFNLLR